MASPFEFSYVFTVIGKIWEAMPVTLLLTFAPLFIGFLFGVPFAVGCLLYTSDAADD